VQAKSIGGGRRRRFKVVAICERDDDLRTVRITIIVHTTICQLTIHGLSTSTFRYAAHGEETSLDPSLPHLLRRFGAQGLVALAPYDYRRCNRRLPLPRGLCL
jgi:hypothetical protein